MYWLTMQRRRNAPGCSITVRRWKDHDLTGVLEEVFGGMTVAGQQERGPEQAGVVSFDELVQLHAPYPLPAMTPYRQLLQLQTNDKDVSMSEVAAVFSSPRPVVGLDPGLVGVGVALMPRRTRAEVRALVGPVAVRLEESEN